MCDEAYRASDDGKSETWGGAAYLASAPKPCGEELLGSSLEVRARTCKSWFCPKCCVGRGLAVREKLVKALQSFKSLQMWTLTIDPELFGNDPVAAMEYVSKKRCVGELVRTLRKRGVLNSDRWFCVLEFQQNGFPHFHLLVDASFVPYDLVADRWNCFRPANAGEATGVRPGFGSVRFSAPKFADHRHAANYACKYLIKHPEHGYPEWVLKSERIVRYRASRGLFESVPRERSADPDQGEPSLNDLLAEAAVASDAVDYREGIVNGDEIDYCYRDETCFCIRCRGEFDAVERPLSIEEKIARCGTELGCVLLNVDEVAVIGGVEKRRRFVGRVRAPFEQVRSLLGRGGTGNRFDVTEAEAARLLHEFSGRDEFEPDPESQALPIFSRPPLPCPFCDEGEWYVCDRTFAHPSDAFEHLRKEHQAGGDYALALIEATIAEIDDDEVRKEWQRSLTLFADRIRQRWAGQVVLEEEAAS